MLREIVLPAIAKPKAKVARLLGLSEQTLDDVLAEKQPVTPLIAESIGRLCGNGPQLWITMQANYDLEAADQARNETNCRRPKSPRPELSLITVVAVTRKVLPRHGNRCARWGKMPTTSARVVGEDRERTFPAD